MPPKTTTIDYRYVTVSGDTIRYAPPGKGPAWYVWPWLARMLKTMK